MSHIEERSRRGERQRRSVSRYSSGVNRTAAGVAAARRTRGVALAVGGAALFATGATVGAPPDRYVRAGQDWGLPPFIPHRLRAAGYEPFIQTMRAAFRHARGLRIDHVMGLFRLFWVPRGLAPAEGGFVRYPGDDLLAIVALESQRARAVVVGEDLGTVETGVRERLAEHDVLSYRVVWFEADPPATFPRGAMAAVTTHDLPTIAGLWTGADLEVQRRCGLQPNESAVEATRTRLGAMTSLARGAPVPEVIERAHALLAQRRHQRRQHRQAAHQAQVEHEKQHGQRQRLKGTVAP